MATATAVAILAVGGFWFYVMLAVLTILIFCSLETEKATLATIAVLVSLVAMGWLGDFNIIRFAAHSPKNFIAVLISYVGLGLVWAFAKWWFFLKSRVREYVSMKNDFLTRRGLSLNTWSPELKKNFHGNNYRASELVKRPFARKNKSRILTWMIYWPWSFLWTMINDPVVRLFKEIFHLTQAMFESISKRVYRGIDE